MKLKERLILVDKASKKAHRGRKGLTSCVVLWLVAFISFWQRQALSRQSCDRGLGFDDATVLLRKMRCRRIVGPEA